MTASIELKSRKIPGWVKEILTKNLVSMPSRFKTPVDVPKLTLIPGTTYSQPISLKNEPAFHSEVESRRQFGTVWKYMPPHL